MARPNLSYLKNLILFVCGLPIGALTGLTAIGSSVPLGPAIRWLLGLRPNRATATALAVTSCAALAGLFRYAQEREVRLGLAALLTVGQIVGASWGTRIILAQPSIVRLRLLWGLLTVAFGLALAAQGQGIFPWHPWLAPIHGAAFWGVAVAVSIGVGLVSRVIELGGVLLVPAMIDLLRLPPHLAQGTALVVLLLAALPAMLIYARRGDLEPQSTIWLSFGGVFGALTGAYWASLIRADDALLTLYGIVLAVIGLTLLWRKDPEPAAANDPPMSDH